MSSPACAVALALTSTLALALSPAAAAQSVDLGFSCVTSAGEPMTTGLTTVWGKASSARCSVDYSNDSGAALTNVWVRVRWDAVVETDLTPDLPGGVVGLDPTQTWRPVSAVTAVPGSPAPSFDLANQTAVFKVGDLADQTASELFFGWLPPPTMPASTYTMHVEAFVGGPPPAGTPDAALDLELLWDPGKLWHEVRSIPVMEADRRFVGSVIVDRLGNPTSAHEDATVVVYLPYRNGSSWRADGAYVPGSHVPLLDASDLAVQLLLKGNSGYAQLDDTMPAGTALDAAGDLSWPLSGPNANALIVYDPDTHTLRASLGVVGDANGGFRTWRLRWDAQVTAAANALLGAGATLPVQSCFQSGTTGVVLPGDPTWCKTDVTVVGDETLELRIADVDCPTFSNYFSPCRGEAMAYTAGDAGRTLVAFENGTSLDGDVDIVVQLPGVGGERVATLTGIALGAGSFTPDFSPAFSQADGVEIWVSTGASDYSGPDVTSRVVGATATWLPCALLGGGTLPVRCDMASLPVAAADVEEVKLVIKGAPSQYLTHEDASLSAPPAWNAEIGWILDDDIGGSIDASAYSATSTKGAAFGVKATAELLALDGGTFGGEDAMATETGEVTRQSLVAACGSMASPFAGTQNASAVSCTPAVLYSVNLGMMSPLRVQWGLQNIGAVDNVTGPFELCTPLPHGFAGESALGPTDPLLPMVLDAAPFGTTQAGTAFLLDPSLYTYTLAPLSHAEIASELCVKIPAYTLAAGRTLQAIVDGRIVPGAHPNATFYDPATIASATIKAQGENAGGAPTALALSATRFEVHVSGVAKVDVDAEVSPATPVGPTATVCYDVALDTHAFLDDGSLDPNGATLATENAVAYQWIPGGSPPETMSGASTAAAVLDVAASPDALGIWVHGADDALRGDATTLAGHGWQACAPAGAACDAAALTGLGLAPADVRWVAFELGRLHVSDAEPRGVAPLHGNARVNAPYAVSLCIADAGSADGTALGTVIETVSSNLLPVITEPPAVAIDIDCPLTGCPPPEVCNGEDDDGDGDTDEDFPGLGLGCTAGLGVCAADGVIVCSDDGLGTVCGAMPGEPAVELCDDVDQDCDGEPANGFGLGEPCTAGLGACAADGFIVCALDGLGTVCDAKPGEPAVELCDDVDQDCDGEPANGFGLGEPCTVGIGGCAVTGALACLADGSGSACDATAGGPASEDCDGVDDDCDGRVDETLDGEVWRSWCLDADGDGLVDASEVFDYGTDPDLADTDGDGLLDGTEVGLVEPQVADATDPDTFVPDADHETTTDPLADDSDGGGVSDGVEDADHDGRVDAGECDPNDDADDDGCAPVEPEPEPDRGPEPEPEPGPEAAADVAEETFDGGATGDVSGTDLGVEVDVGSGRGGVAPGCGGCAGSGPADLFGAPLVGLVLLAMRRRRRS